ncbi:MAG: factor-independent urate hydroxylase [Chthoniobacterales bacterium]
MAKLLGHRYGKARVRVLKVLREGEVHTLKDLDVQAMLQGDFDSSYTEPSGDNTKVVPTDTIKNTVNVLALQQLAEETARFALFLGQHFLSEYPQVEQAEIEIAERPWNRLTVNGKPHAHSFRAASEPREITRVVCTRNSHTVQCGVRDLVILKSTGSGFENYPKDKFTTLPETADRILATSFRALWSYEREPADFNAANHAIADAMLAVFAEKYSPSAQTTLFQMGEAALAACPEISQLDLAMPNKHCLLINMSPFGLENRNQVFVPTDEPHGQIECTVRRDDG